MRGLFEDKRTELLARGKRGEKEKGDGKSRYEKRVKSKFATSTREYNKIDMNQLFKDNILTANIVVRGETDDYFVRIKFGSFLDVLREQIERQNGRLDLRTIIRALISAFNSDNVYIHCSCPDWKYRMSYWATVTDVNSGDPESRPANITNPKNSMGPGCKHVMLVLANTAWLIKVGSVINNYVKYFEKHRIREYADIIYPAIFGKKYEKPVQTSFFDKDELDSEEATLDASNEEGRLSGRFQAGNPWRYQPKQTADKNQLSIENNDDEDM